MNELGVNSKKEHLNIINTCLKIKISNLILVGKIFNKVNFTNYKSFKSISELKNYLTLNKEENTLYLIKGSRSIKLEEILVTMEIILFYGIIIKEKFMNVIIIFLN